MPEPIREIGAPIQPPALEPRSGKGPAGFASVFREALDRVEGLRRSADESTVKLLTGESEELHQAVLAVQRAELAFELFLEVRNKVVQAYQEIMRMQV